LRTLGPLSQQYEYAAEVGLIVRASHPQWWQDFETRCSPRERYVLPQAQGYAFCAWLESDESAVTDEERERAFVVALADSAPRLRSELRAAVAALEQIPVEDTTLAPAAQLAGERVELYAPRACAGYPAGASAYLDEWTAEALQEAKVVRHSIRPAQPRDLARAHDPHYLTQLVSFAHAGGGWLTPETMVSADAPAAVHAAAGALIEASRRALAGKHGLHLCQVRPGSHHAEPARATGTNLVNNLAVCAHWALAHGVGSVGIIDIDAHHGNGSQQIFASEPRVFTLSLHQSGDFFPGTGMVEDQGHGGGIGSNLSLPIDPAQDWLGHFELGVTQLARRQPQLLLVEFSTDAHVADPVSRLAVGDAAFARVAELIFALRVPTVFELGASTSRRAWIGGLRGLVRAWDRAPEPRTSHSLLSA
jgi:acetoin utilization deacetylase AcuC-like enzyme